MFSVNCNDQFKEKDGEVVEEDLVLFSRQRWQSFNDWECRVDWWEI